MTGSMQLIREFCDIFIPAEKVTRTRVVSSLSLTEYIHIILLLSLSLNKYRHMQFFPEANEVDFARKSVFEGSSLKLDYLTKPSLFEDFGFINKVKMADRVKPDDEIFLVAYPYFNVNGNHLFKILFKPCTHLVSISLMYLAEMLVVEELYKEAVVNTRRNLIIFNGELDRIRSGCILSIIRI